MKIIKQTSPYIHKKSSVERMMLDVIIALMPIVIFSIILNGFNAIRVILLSVFTMLISEFVFVFLKANNTYEGKTTFKEKLIKTKEKYTINNLLSPLISSVIYAMIMPSTASSYVVIVGGLFGIIVGKLLFGGLGSNIFNPAALGRIVAMLFFKIDYKGTNGVDIITSGTPLGELSGNLANINNYSLLDMFLGTIPGTMGETSKILIIIGGLYLFIRFSADFRPTLGMIGSFTIIMFICSLKLDSINSINFTLYQLLSGGLLFGAAFMITDPVTSSVTKPGRVTYGIIVGIICAFIRLLGAYPEGCAFAILIGNMLVPVIDYYKWSTNKYTIKNISIMALLIIASSLILFFAI